MKKTILFFVLFCSSLTASEWKFIPFPSELPTDYQSSIHSRKDMLITNTSFYKSKIAIGNKFDGFTIYTGKEWKFFTPKTIRGLIENKEVLDSLNLNTITMHIAGEDSSKRLWLNNYCAMFRYIDTPEKIKVYDKFRCKNGKQVRPYYINTSFINDGEVYCRAFYADTVESPDYILGKYFIYDSTNDEFVEKYEMESELKIYDIKHSVICKDGHIYNYGNLIYFDPNGYIYVPVVSPNIIKLENDTILKSIGPYIAIYYNGSLVNLDSTFKDYKKTLNYFGKPLGMEYKTKYWSYLDRNIYTYCVRDSFYAGYPDYDPTHWVAASNLIIKQNYDSKACDTISVPYIFKFDNVSFFANEFRLNSKGMMALIYYGAGIYLFDPSSSKVEDDDDLIFVVGVSIDKMYPNPTSDKCHIDFFLNRLHSSNIKVQISDIKGNILKDISSNIKYNSTIQRASLDFSVEDLPQGNYYVLFTTNKNKQMRGLLILK